MVTSQSRKIGVFPGPIYFVAMPFGNGMICMILYDFEIPFAFILLLLALDIL